MLLTLGQELPDLPQLMGLMVDDACIPGPDAVGDPFWVLMPVIEGGRGGGMYVPIPDANGESLLPLFIARLTPSASWSARQSPRWVSSA